MGDIADFIIECQMGFHPGFNRDGVYVGGHPKPYYGGKTKKALPVPDSIEILEGIEILSEDSKHVKNVPFGKESSAQSFYTKVAEAGDVCCLMKYHYTEGDPKWNVQILKQKK